MVSLKELKPGDKVRIVQFPPKGSAFTICKDPTQTEMGKWLGKVMTVQKVQTRCVSMKEDGGRWAWTPELMKEKCS